MASHFDAGQGISAAWRFQSQAVDHVADLIDLVVDEVECDPLAMRLDAYGLSGAARQCLESLLMRRDKDAPQVCWVDRPDALLLHQGT